jgi:hypothetical protein
MLIVLFLKQILCLIYFVPRQDNLVVMEYTLSFLYFCLFRAQSLISEIMLYHCLADYLMFIVQNSSQGPQVVLPYLRFPEKDILLQPCK